MGERRGYNAAGQLTALTRLQSVSGCSPAVPLSFNQGWTYNNLNQLTEIDKAGSSFVSYNFSATANNGQITSMHDARTGNTATYTYDLLKRMTNASATGGTALEPGVWIRRIWESADEERACGFERVCFAWGDFGEELAEWIDAGREWECDDY